jgi:hypothetical protein
VFLSRKDLRIRILSLIGTQGHDAEGGKFG